VNTGSDMKDDKLRSKDFFDVKQDPLITFHSNKIVQTGPTSFDVQGRDVGTEGSASTRQASGNLNWSLSPPDV
jgi:hypothetical protein